MFSKSLKNENEELKKEVKSVNVALKAAKKDNCDSRKEFKKKIDTLEGENEKLQHFKMSK